MSPIGRWGNEGLVVSASGRGCGLRGFCWVCRASGITAADTVPATAAACTTRRILILVVGVSRGWCGAGAPLVDPGANEGRENNLEIAVYNKGGCKKEKDWIEGFQRRPLLIPANLGGAEDQMGPTRVVDSFESG